MSGSFVNPDERKRVGIWIRVSTEDQAQGESPENHQYRAQKFAESKGWHVVEVYDLKGVSGRAVMDHPGAKRMLNDVRRGHIKALIFSKLARLGRNIRELLDFADIFKEYNADLISLDESIDTSSPAGRLFYAVIAAMAQWEREEGSDRVKAAMLTRSKLGKRTGGSAPFGYQWTDDGIIPNPEEVPVRRLVYELYIEHQRKKTVARILNERGYRTRNGKEFSDSAIHNFLHDSIVIGRYRRNYTKANAEGKGWTLKPEKDWVIIEVDPIIPQELWDRCQQILQERETKDRAPAKKPVHLFAGYVFCYCGNRMSVPSNQKNKYVCRKCRNKIPIENLEARFIKRLKDYLASPEEVRKHLEQAQEGIEEREKLLDSLRREESELVSEMRKVYRLYVKDQIETDSFGELYNPLQNRRKQLQDEIPRLQGELDYLRMEAVSEDQVLDDALTLYNHWSGMTFEDKRRIIEAIVENIEVRKDDVKILLYYIPGRMVTDDVDPEGNGSGPASGPGGSSYKSKKSGSGAKSISRSSCRKAAKRQRMGRDVLGP